MKRLLEVIFILPLILVAALMVAPGANTAMASGAYTNGDNGKTITVKNGDTFTVKLDENPTTGYSWNLTTDDGLRVADDHYTSNATGRMGAGGYHTWTIKAVKTGTYRIIGVYKRPWESTTGQEEKYLLSVKVVEAQGGSSMFKNITFPAFKRLVDFKPDFSTDLSSFGGIVGKLRLFNSR